MRQRNYNRRAIAEAELVKAQYKRDVACKIVQDMSYYTRQIKCKQKKELLVEYLTTDNSAEWLFDSILENRQNRDTNKVKIDNINRAIEILKGLDVNRIKSVEINEAIDLFGFTTISIEL